MRRNKFCSGRQLDGTPEVSPAVPCGLLWKPPPPGSSLLQVTQLQSFQCFSYNLALSLSLWTVSLHWLPFGNLPPRTECSSPVRADLSLPPSSGTYVFINSGQPGMTRSHLAPPGIRSVTNKSKEHREIWLITCQPPLLATGEHGIG